MQCFAVLLFVSGSRLSRGISCFAMLGLVQVFVINSFFFIYLLNYLAGPCLHWGLMSSFHSAASDLGLHCLPITLLGVSRLQ